PRKGYRFIPPVEAVEEAPTQSKPASAEAKKTSPLPQGWWIWAAVGSVALVVLIVLGFNIGKLRRFNATPVTIQSIAVLPLENLTGEPAQEYFVDGMTDALTTDLGKIGKLRVVSKTSMMRYKDTKKSLQDIASEVDV